RAPPHLHSSPTRRSSDLDYEAGYEDLSPLLQAYDRALLGAAAPSAVPDLMRERNPINFAGAVRAPVLFMIGENDSRCPYRQAMRSEEHTSELQSRSDLVC